MGQILNTKVWNNFIEIFKEKTQILIQKLQKMEINGTTNINQLISYSMVDIICGKYTFLRRFKIALEI